MTEENGIRRAIDVRLSGLTVTPQMRADILRQAREEARPRGRRKMSVSLAFALLALLLAATAYAAVRFGVLSFHENQAENDAYLSHIRPIDERIEGDHATLTVSDAVFDGTFIRISPRKATDGISGPKYTVSSSCRIVSLPPRQA